MLREEKIKKILSEKLNPLVLRIENESHTHSVPKNSETHFKILVVSEQFENVARIQRQRTVNELLNEEFQLGLHALTMRLYSPAEWQTSDEGKTFTSPLCHKK